MREMAQEAGRDPASIEVAPQFVVHLGKTREAARARYAESQMCKHIISLGKSTLKEQKASAEDINLIGSPEEVIEKAMAFRKAGVTHFLGLYFAANTADELVDQMQMFAEEVMPKIK
jgi:alkanesulfonate monooxygenase SsuD/methylene tetrahydromethanopterin reductase-like flavin-dependent oxidoreductase (luciferase family)